MEPVVEADGVRAAGLIAGFRSGGQGRFLSLGDGLCLAVAERLGAAAVTGDRLWATLPDLAIPVRLFR